MGDRAGAGKWTRVTLVGGGLVVVDAVTKQWIQSAFRLGESIPVMGDTLRLTYVLNPGAAFGIHVGPWSRVVFTVLALIALAVIAALVRATPPREHARLVALSLVAGGALGNLADRIVGPGGVVDFLDVGFGTLRWPVFNVADVGVVVGALLLVLLLWRDEQAVAPEPERTARDGILS